MPLQTNLGAAITALLTGTTDLGPASTPQNLSYARTWTSGTAAGQADLVWGDTNTLAASATTDVDLAGSLTGPLGGTITFARVKAILLTADAGNANNVVLGAAASNAFVGPFGASTHTVAVQPGGSVLLVAPGATAWPVTASTADLLRVANSGAGTAVTYSLLIVGASA
ncbi:hypothetical protein GCM10022243_48170 [Saccharothrix violaceirubra]|uniref:Uncharacterized protein n=1 Tax=Saccharothrix violaceirubra TaxID=413306 RepID=A0A7W7WU60_9PSEU|nr:hypothetical protein [Saccharothrix violaceirubra]MBB4963841.1 hypothetical protein [Saccharothrix violaceirubra]